MELNVILVDMEDNEIGQLPKYLAHLEGKLYRAVSVFLFDFDGNWILQQQVLTKSNPQVLWENVCCSHPLPKEKSIDAAKRILFDKTGLEVPLNFAFKFLYKVEVDDILVENELDHVFIGFTNDISSLNKTEAKTWKKMSFSEIDKSIDNETYNYSELFKLLYKKVNLFLALETGFRKN